MQTDEHNRVIVSPDEALKVIDTATAMFQEPLTIVSEYAMFAADEEGMGDLPPGDSAACQWCVAGALDHAAVVAGLMPIVDSLARPQLMEFRDRLVAGPGGTSDGSDAINLFSRAWDQAEEDTGAITGSPEHREAVRALVLKELGKLREAWSAA